MRNNRKNKILCLLATVLIINSAYLISSAKVKPVENHQEIITLAKKTILAYDHVRLEKEKLGIAYNNHPSGLLGPELTGITTTLGSKESKSTALNPNFIGVLYHYMSDLNLSEGDEVALNFSSSFPALNIQAILVSEALGLEPVIISSLGASTYGATDPDFTYLDMEHALYEAGIIQHKSLMYSLGGDYDTGRNMDQEIVEAIITRLSHKGYNLYYEDDLDKNLKARMAIYQSCKALINVGGNTVSETGAHVGYFSRYGYLEASKMLNYNGEGLMGQFLNSGRDVVHMLNIKDIALEFNMPINPSYDRGVGLGGVYEETAYNKRLALLNVGVFILGVGIYYYERKREVASAISEYLKS